METFTTSANLPFSIALAVVVGLAILEVLSLLLGGAGLGFDSDTDLDSDVDIDGVPSQILSWLHFGQMPLTVWLIVFLLSFGAGGLLLQLLLKNTFGAMLPSPLSMLPAFLIALPATRLFGGMLKKVLPKDESEAVSRESFLGQSAVITVGTARMGAPAEARLRDQFGQNHYVMVEPDDEGESFPAGSHVVLVKRHDTIYRVIANAPGIEATSIIDEAPIENSSKRRIQA